MSRIDLIANIRHFKAHEWHHIALDWQDEGSPQNALRLYIDFQESRQGGGPILAQAEFDGIANSWVPPPKKTVGTGRPALAAAQRRSSSTNAASQAGISSSRLA